MARTKQGPRHDRRRAPGAGDDEQLTHQDDTAAPRAMPDVDAEDHLEGYSPMLPDTSPYSMMPPPRPGRQASEASNASAAFSLEAINEMFRSLGAGGNSKAPSASPGPDRNFAGVSPAPGLDLDNSTLNRRTSVAAESSRSRALGKQHELLNRYRSRSGSSDYERQARDMTSDPGERSVSRAPSVGSRSHRASSATVESPHNSAFTDAIDAYASAEFSYSRPVLQYKRLTGKLTREEELQWIRLEARRQARIEHQGRSMTPSDDGGDCENASAAAVFSEIKRMFEAKKRNKSATMEDEVAFMKVEATETDRLRGLRDPQSISRDSTPASNAGMFVNDVSRKRKFHDDVFDMMEANYAHRKLPLKKFINKEEALKKSRRLIRTGMFPNRYDRRAAPSKGYTDDGHGKHVEFGDYFPKATEDDDRHDVIETYKTHVASEVAAIIEEHGTMPVYSDTLLKDRLGKIKKQWHMKTKEFCLRNDIEWSQDMGAPDEKDEIFTRHKRRVYGQVRGGRLTLEQASFFAVEANIEMCRWRHRYHKATNTPNKSANLKELEAIENLKLPTSEEFDKAYKPRYNKLVEFVGALFAETQDRLRGNHERVYGIYPQIVLPEYASDSNSDEGEAEDDAEETAAAARRAEAAQAAKTAEQVERARKAREEADHEAMFPGNADTTSNTDISEE